MELWYFVVGRRALGKDSKVLDFSPSTERRDFRSGFRKAFTGCKFSFFRTSYKNVEQNKAALIALIDIDR